MSEKPTLPPHDVDAETAVLGSILLDAADCLPQIRRVLAPTHFYRLIHATIYQAVLNCWDHRNGAVDNVLVGDELRRMGKLDEIGGSPYLTTLILGVPTCLHGVHYARIVKEFAIRRRMLSEAGRIAARAYNE